MRRLRVILLAVLLIVTAGCGSESTSQEGTEKSGRRYAVLRDDTWRLQEALDPPTDDRVASIERPALDWYAEYVRTTASSSEMVRLSGHEATFDRARSELEGVGFVLEEVNLTTWTGVGGTTSETGARPTVIVLDSGGSSFMLLSYDLELAALTQLANAVETVDETTWVEGGGVVG
ncbi:MAG: hypothetical protein M3P85_01675 [Actinomycetota bacterium]|nr:hypothetical protein [Actinomycetota bacterium]